MMDKIWAPWRYKYIKIKRQSKCIFCQGSKFVDKNYVLFRTNYSVCILNTFPYNNGHLMIAPLRHLKEFSRLKEVEALDLFRSINKAKKLLERVLRPQGYNIGINISKTAGAGISGHLHIHIVPRWRGDTNFMPVLFNTKIITQSLDELYKQLKDAESKTD